MLVQLQFTAVVAIGVHVDSLVDEDSHRHLVAVVVVERMHLDMCHSFAIAALVGSFDN